MDNEINRITIADTSSIIAIKDEIDKSTSSDIIRSKPATYDGTIIRPLGVFAEVLGHNDFINTIALSCSSSYNKTDKVEEMNVEEKYNYILKRISCGHDSILEHSNVITGIAIRNVNSNVDILDDILKFLSACCYLNLYTSRREDGYSILISGSIRGYKHLFDRTLSDNGIDNKISKTLFEIIKDKLKSAANLFRLSNNHLYENFGDYKDTLLSISDDKLDMVNEYSVAEGIYINKLSTREYDCDDDSNNKSFKIIDRMNRITLYNRMKIFLGIDNCEDKDFLEFKRKSVLTTVCFYNMSRTCTHQMVRHRNGITQESARYVDQENVSFTIPSIRIAEDPKFAEKLRTIKLQMEGSSILYRVLTTMGLTKEEARSILVQNVNCRRIFITFNDFTLNKFFNLRCDSHAQEEIRSYANGLKNVIFETKRIEEGVK